MLQARISRDIVAEILADMTDTDTSMNSGSVALVFGNHPEHGTTCLVTVYDTARFMISANETYPAGSEIFDIDELINSHDPLIRELKN